MFRIFRLFIYFILLLSYVKVSILLSIYSLYSTYLGNCKMMFVLLLFFFFIYDLFICHKFTQPCFSGVATTAVGTSVPALRLSLIGRKSRGAFVSATLIGQSKKENGLKRILFFCVRTP